MAEKLEGLDLTEGPVAGTLIRFALPFLAANILQSLYGAVDLFVVGLYCNAESVAAVSTGTQVTQIVTSLITGLTLGSTIIIGEYMGERDMDKVRQTIGTTLTVFLIVSAAITFLLIFFLDGILVLLRTPSESFELTKEYVLICASGCVFICGYNAISAILRGYGDSTRPMIFVLIACVINIGLDFLFVAVIPMGVGGTALATVLSQALSMITAIIYLKKKDFIFDFRLGSFRPHKDIIRKLAKVGIPISLQEIAVRISFLYLTAVMNGIGVYSAAVVGISAKYDVFAMLTATSLANALAAITAQNYGRRRLDRARKSLSLSLAFALCVASAFWLWAQFSPETMIGVFTDDGNVIRQGVPFFRSCSYDYIAVTLVFILNGYLNGRQKTVWTMISCTGGALLLRIPLVYLFSRLFPDDLGKLGMIAPTVSFLMASYTIAYVLLENRKRRASAAAGNLP